MRELILHIINIITESSGYLLMGFTIAGLLHVLLARFPGVIAQLTGRGKRPVVMATLLGLPMPLCSCSVLPAAMTIRRQGASRGATASFLISVPETDVVSIMLTYALLGPILAVYRPIAALVTALTAGLAVNWLDRGAEAPTAQDQDADALGCDHCGTDSNTEGGTELSTEGAPDASPGASIVSKKSNRPWLIRALHYGFVEIFDDVIGQLFIGLVVAGALVAWLSGIDLTGYAGGTPVAYLVMLLVGVPVYVCATASTPIAAGLIVAGVSPGAAMVFLLAGPATNVASFFVLKREFGKSLLVIYIIAIATVSVAMGIGLDWLLGDGFAVTVPIEAHAHGSSDVKNAATVVFLILVIASFYRTRVLGRLWKRITRQRRPQQPTSQRDA